MARRGYAIVGLGARAYLYLEALLGAHTADGLLVGLCEANPGRLARAAAFAARSGVEAPTYAPHEFRRMLRETRPDRLIVTSPDYTHAGYIVQALECGVEVISEKPLAIDAESCRRIVEAAQASERSVTVAFNYRYSPARALLKQVLMSGVIGAVTAVDFEWRLDTHHGADYFRRWHRNKANSGGLVVHKATHHFDLLNWWLGSAPQRVAAHGRRTFYRPETADALGLEDRGERCSACAAFQRCPFRLDMNAPRYIRSLYAAHESHDGYFRDRCVFSLSIDIEDTVNATIEYENGVVANYLLTANAPTEGYRAVFHGARGVVTLETIERPYVRPDDGLVDPPLAERTSIRVQPLFSRAWELAIPEAEGAHAGGDARMLQDLFRGDPSVGSGLAADERAGAWSALVGIAANLSMASGAPIPLADIAEGIAKPETPPDPFGAAIPWRAFDRDLYPFLANAKLVEA